MHLFKTQWKEMHVCDGIKWWCISGGIARILFIAISYPQNQTLNLDKYFSQLDRLNKAVAQKAPRIGQSERCSLLSRQRQTSYLLVGRADIDYILAERSQHTKTNIPPSNYRLFRYLKKFS